MKISIDFETFSEADLLDVGAETYAEHPSTEVLVAAWAVEDEAPRIWWPYEPVPEEWANPDAVFTAWNAPFEMAIARHVLPRQVGEEVLPVEPNMWRCSMAAALYKALPGRLDKAGAALKLTQVKDKEGEKVMRRMVKPRKPTKNNPATRHEATAEEWETLASYCAQDVVAERAINDITGPLPRSHQLMWEATAEMNLRGVAVDAEACAGAERLNGVLQKRNTEKLVELTGGEVTSGNQTAKMREWAEAQGGFMLDMTADTVSAAIDNERMPEPVREMARLRQALSRTSASKFGKMRRCASAGGRIRNSIQFHGATTGRDAGRLHQPQNFARPSDAAESFTQAEIALLADTIRGGDPDMLELMYGDPEIALKDGLRPMMLAAPGHRFIAADLAGIENRIIAAYGDEEWKLDTFREIDKGVGRDIYCRTADSIFGFEVTKSNNPTERQVGKICELAFGYAGGLGAWRKFDSSDKHSDEDVERYKQAWRGKHKGIVDFWYSLDRAAIRATLNPGEVVETHGVSYCMSPCGGWLVCELPSTRKLWYRDAHIEMKPGFDGELRPAVAYMAWRMGQWKRVDLYGGILAENVVQATAYDIIMRGFLKARKAGYRTVLRIHDELVTEMPHGEGSVQELIELMVDAAPWVHNMQIPLAADGWEGERFWK